MKTESLDATISFLNPLPALRRVPSRRASHFLIPLLVLAALFGLAVLLQFLSGAYHSEFSSYPDEPSHYVTSLMLREYIVHPHPWSPMKFAEAYYYHYPKVAFGHWPPFFYVVQALWMLFFSASRMSIRLEIAFTTAVLAFSFWREARHWFGNIAAILASALLICLPVMQESTDEEMAETLLVLCCFWSTIYFGRYLESRKLRDSLWFALFFSLAVLTKGSGWMLVLVPPIAFLLTRKLKLLFSGSFWLGVTLIAALCLPWQIATLHSAARGWAGDSPSVGYTLSALVQFGGVALSFCGPLLSVVIAWGIVVKVFMPLFARRGNLLRRVDTVSAILFALIVSDWIFHSVVPAGVEDRKLLMAAPGFVYFLFAGCLWLADWFPVGPRCVAWRRPVVAAVAALIFFAQTFSIPRDSHYGYAEAARFIAADPGLRSASLLVSSGSIGEGLLISELAMRAPLPQDTVLRATKELAHVDWAGVHYQNRFSNPGQVLHYLETAHVNALVVDSYHGPGFFPHERLVAQTIRENPRVFQLRAQFSGHSDLGEPGKVQIYQLAPQHPARP